MFLGFAQAYERHQNPLIKEALLVGFFLAGLVVLGGLQQWWLAPLVSSLAPGALFFSPGHDNHHRQRRADLLGLADYWHVRCFQIHAGCWRSDRRC
jgi:hypothetical protein